jgi:hypothetical protein
LRSLVFNLLHDCSRKAGCGDEAWEIIAEFAAAEALLDRIYEDAGPAADGRIRRETFVMAAEALLSCLGHSPAGEDVDWDEDARQVGTPSVTPRNN